jgi:glycosyltransferase involved in cell wall biosynthesis
MKVMVVSNSTRYFLTHRIGFARALVASGCEVVCVSPRDGTLADAVAAAGFGYREWNFDKGGINPVSEYGAIGRIEAIYREEKPDLVHHFTQKPVIYGSLAAARIGKLPVINSLTGLGYAYTEGTSSLKKRVIRCVLNWLHRKSHKGMLTRVVFENPDDRDFFVNLGLVPEKSARVVRGSGIDLDEYPQVADLAPDPIVLVPARMLYDKGIREVVEAARILKRRHPTIRVMLAGSPDPRNPESIPEGVLRQWAAEGAVEWLGHVANMVQLYHSALVVCLPSYREGCPRSLLEAASCGLPLVTTDAPGCREVVRDGINGIIVPPKDPVRLSSALESLLTNRAVCKRMGQNGHDMMNREFSVKYVAKQLLGIYREVVDLPTCDAEVHHESA